jgi:hypothetical protein
VRDGSLRYGTGPELSGLELELAMESLSGPFALDGSARIKGASAHFSGKLARLEPGRGEPAEFSISLPQIQASLSFAGIFTELSTGPTLRGRTELSLKRPGDALAAMGLPAQLPKDAPLSGTATLSASAQSLALEDLALVLGPAKLGGAASVALSGAEPQVELALRANGLDLDAWSAATRPTAAAKPWFAPSSAPAQSAPSASGQGAAAPAFTLPAGAFIHAELAAKGVVWHGRPVDVALDATLDKGELAVTRASATSLPGDGVVSLFGILASERGQAAVDGQVDASAADLRQLLAWAGLPAASAPHKARLGFAVQGEWPELLVPDFELVADGAKVRGSGSARLAGRPILALNAKAGTVDLDAITRKDEQPAAAPPKAEPAQAAAAPAKEAPAGPVGKPGFDAEFRLHADKLIVHRAELNNVNLTGDLTDGTLTVGRAQVADLGGAQLEAKGSVADVLDRPVLRQLAASLRAVQPGRLFQALHADGVLAHAGALAAELNASGPANAMALKLKAGTADGLDAALEGTLNTVLLPSFDGLFTMRHPSFAQAARLMNDGWRPRLSGPFSATARLAPAADGMAIPELALAAGDTALKGNGKLSLLTGRPALALQLQGGALDLDAVLGGTERTGALEPGKAPFNRMGAPAAPQLVPAAAQIAAAPAERWSRKPLALDWIKAVDLQLTAALASLSYQGWKLEQPALQAATGNGALSVDKLTGILAGGALDASGKLGAEGGFTLRAAISGAEVKAAKLGIGPVQVSQGKLDADQRWTASGRSPAELIASLTGGGRFTVRDGVVTGFDLPAINAQMGNLSTLGNILALAKIGLGSGQTKFSALSGTIEGKNGVVSTQDLKLAAEGGRADARLSLDLPRWTQDSTIDFRLAQPDSPPLVVKLDGPLDAPRKVVDLNALQRWLSEKGMGAALGGNGFFDKLARKPRSAGPNEPPPPHPASKPVDVLRGFLQDFRR